MSLPKDKNIKIYYRNKKLNEKYVRDLDTNVKQYCFKRGLDNYDIAKFELGYDIIENRLTFPLYDMYNNIVGFNKRRIDNVKDKKIERILKEEILEDEIYKWKWLTSRNKE